MNTQRNTTDRTGPNGQHRAAQGISTMDSLTDVERAEQLRRAHAELDAIDPRDEYGYAWPGNPNRDEARLLEFERERQQVAGQQDVAASEITIRGNKTYEYKLAE